jgi:hypothetical protein
MDPILSISMWVSIPNEVRYRIRSIFKIPMSSNTVVDDGRILTDGTTNEDFKHLTIQKMQIYLDDDSTDFHKLFDKVVARVNDDLYPKFIEEQTLIVSPGEPIILKKRIKNAKIKQEVK